MSNTGQPPVSSIPDNAAATGNTSAAVLSTVHWPPNGIISDGIIFDGIILERPAGLLLLRGPWKPDSVLEGYQQATVHLGEDAEGEIVATFVRKDRRNSPCKNGGGAGISARPSSGHHVRARVERHFYRRHASEHWESLGIPFYAVDLRKFGRSYRPYQTPGISRICTNIVWNSTPCVTRSSEQGKDVRILMIAHSKAG